MSMCLFSNFYFFQDLHWNNTHNSVKRWKPRSRGSYTIGNTITKCLLQDDFPRLRSMDRVLAF